MKPLVLLLWGGCLLSVAGALFRLVCLSSPWERLFVLSLATAAALCARPASQMGGRGR